MWLTNEEIEAIHEFAKLRPKVELLVQQMEAKQQLQKATEGLAKLNNQKVASVEA